MFGMTAIHITHDQEEAMALADRIICMRSGRIEQIGAPREIYRSPVNRNVADFIGSSNILEPNAVASAPGGSRADFGAASLLSAQPVDAACPQPVVAVRVEAVELHDTAPTGPNVLEAKVTKVTYLGSHSLYHLESGPLRLIARSITDYMPGQAVHLSIDPADVRLIAPGRIGPWRLALGGRLRVPGGLPPFRREHGHSQGSRNMQELSKLAKKRQGFGRCLQCALKARLRL